MTVDDRAWETGATWRERWEGYLDPATGLLKNYSDPPVQTWEQLRAFEDSHVSRRGIELRVNPIDGDFGLDHWRAIHRHLFQGAYPWAGDVRTVNIAKGERINPDGTRGPAGFLPVGNIPFELNGMSRLLREEDYLRGTTPEQFADRIAFFYDLLNNAHPAREGNGRTQRALWDELARQTGHRIDWKAAAFQTRNDDASMQARVYGNLEPLRQMFRECVVGTPEYEARARAAEAARLAGLDRPRMPSAHGRGGVRSSTPYPGYGAGPQSRATDLGR